MEDGTGERAASLFSERLQKQDLNTPRIPSSTVPSTALNGLIMINIPGVKRKAELLGCKVFQWTAQRLKSI